MPFSTTIDNSILDHWCGNSTWTAPTATWVGLSSTTPTKTGTNVTEPSGGAYARQQVTSANWSAASSSAITNGTAVTYPQATADWVGGSNLTYLVYYDAVTSGNFLGYAGLTVAKPVLNGDTASFPINDLDVTIT